MSPPPEPPVAPAALQPGPSDGGAAGPGSLATMVRNSAIFGAGEIVLKTMTAVLAPLFTVLLTPTEYGVWGLGTMIQSLLAPLFSLGLHGAVTRFYFDSDDPKARAQFQGTISAFLLVWGVTLSAIVLIAGHWLQPFLLPSLPYWPYVPVIVGTVLLGLAATVPTATWTAAERAGRVVLVRTASNAVYLLMAVGLVAIWNVGVEGVFWARLSAALVLAVPLLLWARRSLPLAWHQPSLVAALAFSLPLVPHLIAHWVLALSDRYLLERLMGTSAVGVYTSAYVFTDAVNLVAVSLNGAFVPMLNRHLDRAEGEETVKRAVSWFVGVVLTMSAAISVLSPTIVRAFFHPRYHGAADVAAILGAAGALQGLYYIWVGALFFRKTSGRVPLLTILGGGVNIGLNLLWIPRWGLAGAAFATAVGYGTLLAGVWFTARVGGGLPIERGRTFAWFGMFGVVVAAGALLDNARDLFDGAWALPLVALCKFALLALAAAAIWRLGILREDDKDVVRGRIGKLIARLRR